MGKTFGFYWMMEGVCNEYVRAVVHEGRFSRLADIKARRIESEYSHIINNMVTGLNYGFIDQSQYDEYLHVISEVKHNASKWAYDFEVARLGEAEYEIQYTMHQLKCGRIEAVEYLKYLDSLE